MAEKNSARRKIKPGEARELDVQIGFIEGLVRRDPNYVEALQLLGDSYTQRGRFAEGLEVDERLARIEPQNPLVLYNLACSYSLTDQFDRAAATLKKALECGYRDIRWLKRDPDLRKLRKHPLFRDIAETLRQLSDQER
jgi:tetratricopeptide (TPR) repeat protein